MKALPSALVGLMGAGVLSVVAGAAYIIDCRAHKLTDGAQCWLTGLPIMGLGGGAAAGGAAGFRAGFNTFNPALRRPRDPDQDLPSG